MTNFEAWSNVRPGNFIRITDPQDKPIGKGEVLFIESVTFDFYPHDEHSRQRVKIEAITKSDIFLFWALLDIEQKKLHHPYVLFEIID